MPPKPPPPTAVHALVGYAPPLARCYCGGTVPQPAPGGLRPCSQCGHGFTARAWAVLAAQKGAAPDA